MELATKHCVPCEGGTEPFSDTQEDEYLNLLDNWVLDRASEQHSLRKQFKLKSFKQAMEFVDHIAAIAEAEKHHPVITINYNRVTVSLYTHAIQGLSENDFIVAARIDAI